MIMRRTLIRNQEGVAAIEFALLLPFLILLILGIIEFGVIFYNQAMITNASREGARSGIVYNFDQEADSPDEDDITGVVTRYLDTRLINFKGNTNVTVSTEGAQGQTGESLTVHVAYEHGFLILPDFAGSLFGSTIGNDGGLSLSAQTVMRME